MHTANNKIIKRPFTVFLYDRTETGQKSHELIAAETTTRQFPYVKIGGIYVDNLDILENRPAFDKMMDDCDSVAVDCIAVPSEDCLHGDIDLTCETFKLIAERGIEVLDLETGIFLDYKSIWEGMVQLAEKVLYYEKG